MIILLPPSEGKAPGGRPRTSWDPSRGSTGRTLGPMRVTVAGALRKAKGGSPALLGVKGDVHARAAEANSRLVGSPTLPAWERYTGVVWDHLDLASLPAARRTAAVSMIFVPSGLMGLVRADDPVPDYKLKIGASLPATGRLATFWRQAVTDELVRIARGQEIVDLLPNEHRGAFDWSRVPGVTRLDLVSHTGGAVGGHNAKAAKGLLARHLLAGTGTTEKKASGFRHADYSVRVTR